MSSKKTTKTTTKATTAKRQTKGTEPTPMREDGRMGTRVPIQLLVDYQCEGHYLFDFCRDLGAGGVFIQTNNPLENGSVVNLVFTLPDSKETLETKGRVIWVQNKVPGKDLMPGMGVQFENFDPKQRKLLEDFVARFHGNGAFKAPGTDHKTA